MSIFISVDFAGPVLTQDAVDPAMPESEIDTVAGDHLPETLGDVDELGSRRRVGLPAGAVIGRGCGHRVVVSRRRTPSRRSG
jgi:hypothetical protein